MPVSKAPDWATIKNKPTDVAGLGVSDFDARAIAAQANATAGTVGTYALLNRNASAGQVIENATVSGSSLRYAHANTLGFSTTSPSGTWKCMCRLGYWQGSASDSSSYQTGVFLRIA